jgi:hypothetical protein
MAAISPARYGLIFSAKNKSFLRCEYLHVCFRLTHNANVQFQMQSVKQQHNPLSYIRLKSKPYETEHHDESTPQHLILPDIILLK